MVLGDCRSIVALIYVICYDGICTNYCDGVLPFSVHVDFIQFWFDLVLSFRTQSIVSVCIVYGVFPRRSRSLIYIVIWYRWELWRFSMPLVSCAEGTVTARADIRYYTYHDGRIYQKADRTSLPARWKISYKVSLVNRHHLEKYFSFEQILTAINSLETSIQSWM